MISPLVLITDTNIWIDLKNGGILHEVFLLPFLYRTPDFAISELIDPAWDLLNELGLEAIELSPDQVSELLNLSQTYRSLSILDLSAFIISKELKLILITGDSHLTKLALRHHVEVHGVLWLLDEMVQRRIVDQKQAARALRRIIDKGARLPAAECKQRLDEWES